MVEVFKTNITSKEQADRIVRQLQACLPAAKINFDLHDCDNILRIESQHISLPEITELVAVMGFYCEVLE
ncbi:MAG: hypothetical protein ICV66_08535 [Chitinophagaceae bacterium]|nr:hypothetical protein [Chitinophagaceae bacterium]